MALEPLFAGEEQQVSGSPRERAVVLEQGWALAQELARQQEQEVVG